MLLVSGFTFFGLSGIQSLSYYTDLFGDLNISFNLTAQEEENETSNNEVQEVKEKLSTAYRELAIYSCNISNAIAWNEHVLKLHNGFFEVATPPPRLSIL
jgi:hypothetical protein